MNIVLCLFVIFIHVASAAVSTADRSAWQYAVLMLVWRGCSLAVPAFIFLAAVKLAMGLNKAFSYPKYLLSRLKRVLLPYLAVSAVYAVYFTMRGFAAYTPASLLKEVALGSVCGHFYFVIIILQFYLTAPLWRALAKRLDSTARIAAALIASYFVSQLFGQYFADFLHIFDKSFVFAYSDRIFTTYLFWWTAGLAVGRHYEKAKDAAKRDFVPSAVLFGFAAVTAGFLDFLHFTGRESIWWLETAHTFYIFAGICFMFALAVRFSTLRLPSPLVYVDRASYSIYLWHPLTLYIADSVSGKIAADTLTGSLAVRILFGFGLTISVCACVSFLTKKLTEIAKTRLTASKQTGKS